MPSIESQNEFAAIVEKTEALKEKLKSSLLDLENLYGALSQKAFKGELDLSNMQIDPALLPVSQETINIENKDSKDKIDNRKESDKITKKLPERKSKDKSVQPLLDWGKVSSEQIANWVKEEFEDYHFNSEMMTNYLLKEKVNNFDYFTSEEILKNPKITGSEDLKSFVFSAIDGENPFLKLEQIFYNAVDDDKNLQLREEDYKLIEKRSKQERSGIYFRIEK